MATALSHSESLRQVVHQRPIRLPQHISQLVASLIDKDIDRHTTMLHIDLGFAEDDMKAAFESIDSDNRTFLTLSSHKLLIIFTVDST